MMIIDTRYILRNLSCPPLCCYKRLGLMFVAIATTGVDDVKVRTDSPYPEV